MMKKLINFLLLSSALVFSACEKDEPKETEEQKIFPLAYSVTIDNRSNYSVKLKIAKPGNTDNETQYQTLRTIPQKTIATETITIDILKSIYGSGFDYAVNNNVPYVNFYCKTFIDDKEVKFNQIEIYNSMQKKFHGREYYEADGFTILIPEDETGDN